LLQFCGVMKSIPVIVAYRAEHQPHFERLNKAWIERYFVLEDIDRFVLGQPEEAILAQGGAILMALLDGVVAGTVALKKVDDRVYEFTKMAVDETFRRKGIAEALSYAAMEKARELGAEKIILYSQTSLEPAIALYRKLGFREVPLEPGTYQRANIKMEFPLTDSLIQTHSSS
jgi:ribosomal protein S18 acetylase RimI-like enzyme